MAVSPYLAVSRIETLVPPPAWLSYALAAFTLLWGLSAFLRRARRLSLGVAVTLQLGALLLIYEGLRRWAALPSALQPWLQTIELALLAFLTIQVVVQGVMGRPLDQRRHATGARILRDLATVLIALLFVLLFLRLVLRVNLAAILTPSAILTAIIGLSLQDTIGNFFSGLILQIEKPFDLNDWIEVDGQRGQVREMNWRYTKIETADRIYIVIPNHRMAMDKIVNVSQPTPVMRQFLTLGVSYDTPPVKIKQAVRAALRAVPQVIQEEDCEVFLHEYGDSSMIYRIGFHIRDPGRHRAVRDEVYSAIWYQFRRHGIEIPFPIRTVIMRAPPAEPDAGEPVRQLACLPLFEGVQPENLAGLVQFGLTHVVAPGREVVRDGEPGETLFFILEGDFTVLTRGRAVATLRPGDVFGEMSLLTGAPRTATITAASRGRLLEIDRSTFTLLIESEPRMLGAIERLFAERARANAAQASAGISPALTKDSLWGRFKKRFGLA